MSILSYLAREGEMGMYMHGLSGLVKNRGNS